SPRRTSRRAASRASPTAIAESAANTSPQSTSAHGGPAWRRSARTPPPYIEGAPLRCAPRSAKPRGAPLIAGAGGHHGHRRVLQVLGAEHVDREAAAGRASAGAVDGLDGAHPLAGVHDERH